MLIDDRIKIIKCILSDITETGNDLFQTNCIDLIDWNDIYSFLDEHKIVPMFSNVIEFIPKEYTELIQTWKAAMYANIYSYSRLVKTQNTILERLSINEIPVVVLKGTSAVKYYPIPFFRTLGDIDLLVEPNCYDKAVRILMDSGCHETTTQTEIVAGIHRSFVLNGVVIELHHIFSSQVNGEKAPILDRMLINAIPEKNTILPDDENGIVILAHIGQHLEGGLGFRQIIDWFMFVRACLNDKMWYSSFQEKARITGLETLAITVTRMCQIYLGLTTEKITWCKDTDEAVCEDLMQYVMDCGNFGRSREMLQSSAVEKIPSIRHPIQLIKYIQSHGETNWKALKKHPWLKPFAWIYQSCRYIKLAIQNKVTPNKLKAIYDEGNKRNEMFAALGLK